MDAYLTTRAVCADLGLTEPCLRHVLRRTGAPRPPMHPSARVFLWTQADLARLKEFLAAKAQPKSAVETQAPEHRSRAD